MVNFETSLNSYANIGTPSNYDCSAPQFFRVTVDGRSYIVKSSYRSEEYANSCRIFDKINASNALAKAKVEASVCFPRKFALYDHLDKCICGLYDAKSEQTTLVKGKKIVSFQRLPAKEVMKIFLKGNTKLKIFTDGYITFLGVPQKIFLQLMPLAKGECLDDALQSESPEEQLGEDIVSRAPQKVHDIGRKTGHTLSSLHSISFNEKNPLASVMLHGDLHYGNIIYNRESDRVSIIDPGINRIPENNAFGCDYINNDFFRLVWKMAPLVKFQDNYDLMPNDLVFLDGFFSGYKEKEGKMLAKLMDLSNPIVSKVMGFQGHEYNDFMKFGKCIVEGNRRDDYYFFMEKLVWHMAFVFPHCTPVDIDRFPKVPSTPSLWSRLSSLISSSSSSSSSPCSIFSSSSDSTTRLDCIIKTLSKTYPSAIEVGHIAMTITVSNLTLREKMICLKEIANNYKPNSSTKAAYMMYYHALKMTEYINKYLEQDRQERIAIAFNAILLSLQTKYKNIDENVKIKTEDIGESGSEVARVFAEFRSKLTIK
jgi:hypothetical protein